MEFKLIGVFVLLFVSSWIYIKIAKRFNIIDKPNQRSSHTEPTIRGGGILFFIGTLLFFVLSDFSYPYFFIGVFVLSTVSFIDDVISLSPNTRLLFHFLSIGLIIFQTDLHLIHISLPFLALIPAIAVLNIYNFMDGINGITGLNALVIIFSFLVINIFYPFIETNELMIYIIFSLLVFGFYNFRKKARFFAGDIGSICLAAVVIFLLLVSLIVLKAPILVLLLGVYGVDSVATIYRRYKNGEKLSEAHRGHLYQLITDRLKYPHMVTSLFYAIVQLILLIPILTFMDSGIVTQAIVLLVSYLVLLILHQVLVNKINKRFVG